jgi:hypothetical protein
MNEMNKETILKGMDLSLHGLFGISLLIVLLGIGYCCFPNDNTQKNTQEINFDQYQQVKEWYDQYPNLKNIIQKFLEDDKITYQELNQIVPQVEKETIKTMKENNG